MMRLTLFDTIVAEGDAEELVKYTWLLLEVLKMRNESEKREEARAEAESFADFLSRSFEEMMRQERGEENSDD